MAFVLEALAERWLLTNQLWNILHDKQHGFRKGLSCETQLTRLINDLAQIVDSRSQANLVIMDFSEAFDTVPHNRLLLMKLQKCRYQK